jgi:hypothetical protein
VPGPGFITSTTNKNYHHNKKARPISFLNIDAKIKFSWVLVTYAYNPGYLGGRDQENHG